MAGGPAASQQASDERSTPLNRGLAHDLVGHDGNGPKIRTPELVAGELESVRGQLDRCVAAGRLRLAGECCVELDQLLSELGRLRRGTRDTPLSPAHRYPLAGQ
jgi:hypothetical protein